MLSLSLIVFYKVMKVIRYVIKNKVLNQLVLVVFGVKALKELYTMRDTFDFLQYFDFSG